MEKDALAGYSGGAPYGHSMLLTQQLLPQVLQIRSMETCLGSTLGLSPRPDPPGPTVDPALGPGPIGAVESNPLYHLDHKSLNSP